MDSREVGHYYLGPILWRFCRDLDNEIRQSPDATVLFVSRGGFRIRYLLKLMGFSYPQAAYFRISRASVARACYAQVPQLVTGILAECTNIRADLSNYAQEYALLRRYVQETCKGRTALMIDTGSRGTAQFLLSQTFPEYEWRGLYFMLNNYLDPKVDPPWFSEAKGLWINSEHRELITYWHLVEDTLEARIPTVTTFTELGFDENGIPPRPGSMFEGVCDYFTSRVACDPERVYRELAHRVLYPSERDVEELMVPDRDGIPVIATEGPFRVRCQNTLWPQGQLRHELGRLAFPAQIVLNLYGKVKGKW